MNITNYKYEFNSILNENKLFLNVKNQINQELETCLKENHEKNEICFINSLKFEEGIFNLKKKIILDNYEMCFNKSKFIKIRNVKYSLLITSDYNLLNNNLISSCMESSFLNEVNEENLNKEILNIWSEIKN